MSSKPIATPVRRVRGGRKQPTDVKKADAAVVVSAEGGPAAAAADAFPLPAAMNRLARAFGLGVDATDAALTREYGAAPKRESISSLAEELGAGFRLGKGDLTRLDPDAFPVVVLMRTGGAVIVHARNGEDADVERPSGRGSAPLADINAASIGVHLRFELTAASSERLARIEPVQRAAGGEETDAPHPTRLVGELFGMIWRRHKREATQLLVSSLLINLFMIALPLYIMSVYDRVIPHTAFESLIALTIGVMLILATDLALRYVRLKFIDAIGLSVSRDLQARLYRRLLFISLAKRPKSASAIVNAQSEIDAICHLAPEFFASMVADVALAATILALIAYIGGAIVLAPIIGVATVAAAVFLGSRSARPHMTRQAALKTAATAQLSETFDSLTAVKANGAEHALLSQFERIGDAAGLTGHLARQRSRFSGQAASVIAQATIVGTLFLGVVRIDAGAMSIGALAATTILVGRAVMPISQLVDQFNRLWTLKDVLAPAFEAVDAEEEKGGERDGGEGRRVMGDIRLQNVSYKHESANAPALKDLNLHIAPGEKIGLIGKNGSGKSTLLHLLPRLYTPTDGTVLIDGYDARQFSARRVRQEIGLMPQEIVLFNAPLKDNILLGAADATDEDFLRAVTTAGVDRFVRRHPEGFSMQVGPRGEFLSAGERQAVGLARALLRRRKVLLLDEPTSMMDHTAEALVIENLARAAADMTLIVSTHRLRLLELVDRVIVLDEGRIVADGPRDQVLAELAQPAPAANRPVRRSA